MEPKIRSPAPRQSSDWVRLDYRASRNRKPCHMHNQPSPQCLSVDRAISHCILSTQLSLTSLDARMIIGVILPSIMQSTVRASPLSQIRHALSSPAKRAIRDHESGLRCKQAQSARFRTVCLPIYWFLTGSKETFQISYTFGKPHVGLRSFILGAWDLGRSQSLLAK